MSNIHPTATIEPGATIADDAIVGPYCHVGPKVTIGAGTHLKSHVAVTGRTTLGEHNVVWPFAVLGGDPQDLKFKGEDSELVIGDHNQIRESVTIQKGTANDDNITRVGSHNLIMCYVHVGHDCIIGDHIVIANNVQLAGHILMEDHANIGGATAVHHFVTISEYAYVGGMTRIVADVPPYMLVEGNPSRVRRVNSTLLTRSGFDDETIDALKKAFRQLYHKENIGGNGQGNGGNGNGTNGGNGGNAPAENTVGKSVEVLASLDIEYKDNKHIQHLVESIRRSQAGTHGRYREAHRKDNPFTNPVK